MTTALLFGCVSAPSLLAQAKNARTTLRCEGELPVLTFRGPKSDTCLDVHPLDDGGFVVVGSTMIRMRSRRGGDPGDSQGFVACYDKAGQRRFMTLLGGKGLIHPCAVDIDPKGRIVVAGIATEQVDFDPGAATAILEDKKLEGFVACYDVHGKFQWVTGVPCRTGTGVFLNLDASGPIHMTASRPPARSEKDNPHWGSFLVQLDAKGKLQSQKELAFAAMGLTADSSGGCFVVGLDMVMGDDQRQPGVGMRLTHFDKKGKALWSHLLEVSGAGTSCLRGLACDKKGALFLAATVGGSVDFDPGPKKHEFEPKGDNSRGRMVVVARYAEKDGKLLNAFGFARTYPLVMTRLALDGIGDVYVTGAGRFGGGFSLDPKKEKKKAPDDGARYQEGYFIAKYSPTGKLIWDHVGVVSPNDMQGSCDNLLWGLAVDKRFRLFAAGRFANDLKLPGGREFKNATDSYEGVVLRLDSMGRLK